MKPQLTGKALVAAGHLLAKQIGPNTPLKDISALISSLASHLDVALVRGDLLQQQANQLAAENVKATEIIAQCKSYFIAGITNRVRPTNEGYLHMMCDTFKDESPATEAVLNSVRAEAIPEGFVLVPQQISLSASAMESLGYHCGDGGFMFGEYTDGILWIGDIENDDGTKTYGLNIATAEYPSEGSTTLCELPKLLTSQAEEMQKGGA